MRPYLLPLMLVVALTSVSCSTLQASGRPTPTAATEVQPVACTAFAPIMFSRLQDTEETIAAVKQHNATYDALCRR